MGLPNLLFKNMPHYRMLETKRMNLSRLLSHRQHRQNMTRGLDVALLLFMINESWDNNCNYKLKTSRACNLLMSQGCYNSPTPFQLLLLNVRYLCIRSGLHFFIILYHLSGIALLCMPLANMHCAMDGKTQNVCPYFTKSLAVNQQGKKHNISYSPAMGF